MTKPILIILSNQQEPIFSQTYIKTTDKQTISSAVQTVNTLVVFTPRWTLPGYNNLITVRFNSFFISLLW